MSNEYEYHMMYLWDRLKTLLNYENVELTYPLFETILNYKDFDIEGVNVSISQYENYERMFGKSMFRDLCRTYDNYQRGVIDEDLEQVKQSKQRLYNIWKTMEVKS